MPGKWEIDVRLSFPTFFVTAAVDNIGIEFVINFV